MKLIIAFTLISLAFCDYKWLPAVSGYSETDSNNGYAGIIGKDIVGIKISCGLEFRIHYLGKSSWEAATTAQAGNLKDKIDGLAIKGGNSYKVYAKGQWLPAVTGYNTGDDINGYAGVLGYEISGVMIKGCSSYAVAYYVVGGGGDDDIIPPNKNQVFVNTGTGVRDITPQYLVPNMESGCLFMACCVIGGLGNDEQIQNAYQWALSKGYIERDTYVNMGSLSLAKLISEHYGTIYHSGWGIGDANCGHFWAVDENGKEVFNASGLGYKGRGC
jgi:hypothetical protein